MICKNCGKELAENVKFCTSCGTKTAAEETAPAEIKPAEVNAPEEAAPVETVEKVTGGDADIHNEAPAEDKNPEEEKKTPETPAEPVQEDTKPKKIGAGRFIGAGVIALFAFVFLMVFNVLISTRIGFGSDIIRNTAEELRMETLLDSELENGQTAAEYIYDCLDHSFISKTGAQVKDVREILIECDTEDLIAQTLSGYAAYMIDGTSSEDPSLTTDDIADFLRDNGDIVTAELDCELAKSDYNFLVDNAVGEDFDEYTSVAAWSDEIGFSVHSFHFFFSFITLGVIAAIAALLFIWMAVVLGKRGRYVAGYISNVMLIAGLLFFVPSLIFLIGSGGYALYSGSATVYAASVLLVPFAAISACTGAFEIVAAVILRKIRKHIRKKESSAAEVLCEGSIPAASGDADSISGK